MEKGYVKLYRAIDDNELLANDNTCYVVFCKLLTRVDRNNGTYRTGRFKLASTCNMNPNTLYSALKRLEASTMIQQDSNNSSTCISICNWWKYQQDSNSSSTVRQRTVNTKQEREREKEVIDTKVSIHDKDVLEAFNLWNELTGKQMRAEKSNSRTIKKLIKQNGIESVLRAIQGAVYYQTKDYRPKVFSFNTLEKKWTELNGWMDTDLKSKAGKGVDL